MQGPNYFCTAAVTFTRREGVWQAGEVRAKFLVDAMGRNGLLVDHEARSRPGGLPSGYRAATIQWSVTANRICAPISKLHRQGGGIALGCRTGCGVAMFFTGAEVYREAGISITEQLRAATLTRRRLGEGCLEEPRIVHTPSGLRKNVFGADWVAVGDSASSYDPLSGRGIFKALRHGQAAAHAVDAQLRGDPAGIGRYGVQVRQQFEQYARQRSRYYSLERRWVDEPFWLARRGSAK